MLYCGLFLPLGWILIDRCGKHFGTILNYLRDGAVPLPESRREIEELLAEAKYYLVQGLVDECQAALQVGCGQSFGVHGRMVCWCPHAAFPKLGNSMKADGTLSLWLFSCGTEYTGPSQLI